MSTTAADQPLIGYRRADGRVGLRDHLLVLSTVALTNRWAGLAAAAAPGAAALVVAPEAQRGLRGDDPALQQRVLDALVAHPNVGAALVLTHDAAAARAARERLAALGKPVETLALLAQDGGMTAAVDTAGAALTRLAASRSTARPEPVGLEALCVALECGGSDTTSALCANPAIGRFVDQVIAAGGQAIVSETVEFIGAEPAVDQRTPDPNARAAIRAAVARRERWLDEDGDHYRGVNPTAENIEGGLTTLIEKSMGAVVKTGTAPFVGALGFAERPKRPGLYFMDTPFFTPVSLTGMIAAGANLVLFGIGQFNPSASPLAPTLKVCGNPQTLARWRDAIDIDAGGVLDGSATLDNLAEQIARRVAEFGAGALSASERWGEGQVIIPTSAAAI